MHKDKAWHFHFLISGIDDRKIVYTGKVGKGKYVMSELKAELMGFTGKKIYAHEKYNFGYFEVSKIEDSKKASNYITKYITKDLFKLTSGDKRVRRYWLYDNEYIKSNISKRISVMKGVKKQIIILDDDEIATIIYSTKGTTERAWRKRAYPHLFRHPCITRMCLYTDNIFQVQRLAGHKDLVTTRRYHHVVLSYDHMKQNYSKTSQLLAEIKLPSFRINKYNL
ncbi:MAG: hypothetical protein CVU98_07415 [Firmicutes bacterium HGW-Firmicutes-3]|jgi:integrase|nr:MAG: hypothetical protein CVU98_07415 [Firmicutes bacterium HGW-Firmicutes-3]